MPGSMLSGSSWDSTTRAPAAGLSSPPHPANATSDVSRPRAVRRSTALSRVISVELTASRRRADPTRTLLWRFGGEYPRLHALGGHGRVRRARRGAAAAAD